MKDEKHDKELDLLTTERSLELGLEAWFLDATELYSRMKNLIVAAKKARRKKPTCQQTS